jgi:hypothetical protein
MKKLGILVPPKVPSPAPPAPLEAEEDIDTMLLAVGFLPVQRKA